MMFLIRINRRKKSNDYSDDYWRYLSTNRDICSFDLDSRAVSLFPIFNSHHIKIINHGNVPNSTYCMYSHYFRNDKMD